MKLVEIEKFAELIENKDTLLIDERTNEQIEKQSVGHYVIMYNSRPEEWESMINEKTATKKKGRGRRKKVVEEDQEENNVVNNNEDEVLATEDQLVRAIAKKLKITEYSSVILKNDGWFIVPIFKEVTELRPIQVVKNTKNYSLIIKDIPLCDFGTDIMKGCRPNDFRYNSLDILHSALREFGIDNLIPKAIFRCRKSRQDLVELRTVVSQCELLQRTRIKVGNNIISSIFVNMGRTKFIESKEEILSKKMGREITEEESLEKLDNVKVLDIVVREYNKITQYAEENNIVIKDNKSFKGLETPYISSYMIYCIVDEYINLLNIETKMNNAMKMLVREQPIWTNYLVGIKGVGESSAAYLISYFDIYKADHPSGFLRYVGLDQVPVTPDKDQVVDSRKLYNVIRLLMRDYELINSRAESASDKINEYNFNSYSTDSIDTYAEYLFVGVLYEQFHDSVEDYIKNDDVEEIVEDIMRMVKKNKVAKEMMTRITTKYEIQVIDGLCGENTPLIKKRARRMTDKEIVPYLSTDGKIKLKQCLGYNSPLKSKLLGVLSGSFLKTRGCEYEQLYRDYRARLEARGDDKKTIHRKAARFQIQTFLEDYWIAVRTLEGLPLNGGTYREEKLKLYHRNRNGEIRQRPQLQPTPQKIKTNKNVVKY